MKVVGIARMQGSYEGREYDNFNLYCVSENNRPGYSVVGGVCPNTTVKVKSTVLFETVTPETVKNLVNHEIDCYYDQYKNVCKVFLKQ